MLRKILVLRGLRTAYLGAAWLSLFTRYYSGDRMEDEMGVMLHVWKEEKCIKFFGRKPVRKKSLVRPRNRWKDNIYIDIKQKRMTSSGVD
jgi:hypothetical protein